MLAQLHASSGARASAVATQRALLAGLTARGETSARMVDASRQAISRLSN
jgi:hypothetical protein